jgi:TRAP-type mannitol/chloroaromatic compound transport system permease large subunit
MAVSPGTIALVVLSAAAQVLGLFLLPQTRGLTNAIATIAAAAAFLFGIGLMARITHAGVNLSLLVPLLATMIPLGGIAVGIFAYGETASLGKIGALILACALIGLSNFL